MPVRARVRKHGAAAFYVGKLSSVRSGYAIRRSLAARTFHSGPTYGPANDSVSGVDVRCQRIRRLSPGFVPLITAQFGAAPR